MKPLVRWLAWLALEAMAWLTAVMIWFIVLVVVASIVGFVVSIMASPSWAVEPMANPTLFDLIEAEASGQAVAAGRVIPAIDVSRRLNSLDVARLVVADLHATGAANDGVMPFLQYVWVDGADPDVQAEVNVTMNEVWSRNEIKVRPAVLYGGHLLRYDLRELAPKSDDLLNLLFVRADMAFDDPFFHLSQDGTRELDCGRFCWDGEWFTRRQQRLAIYHPYLGPVAEELAELTGTVGTVYRADWLIELSNTTVNGGRYYDFRRIDKSAPKGQTPLDLYLSRYGLSVKRLESFEFDERAVILRRGPTNKPGVVQLARTANGRVSSSSGIVAITMDPDNKQVAERNDPLRNLLRFEFAAYEIIADLPNGMHEYSLWDAKGNRLDEASIDVADDEREPRVSQRKSLLPALSCRRCHGQEDGWMKFRNDLHLLVKDRGRDTVTVFDDLSSPKNPEETLAAIARLYSADLNAIPLGPLTIARQQYAMSMSKVTLGKTVAANAKTLDQVHQRYFVDLIGPKQACREIGLEFKSDYEAARWLEAVLPRPLQDLDGSSPEDPIIASLMVHGDDPKDDRQFLPIQRVQFNSIYGDLLTRVYGRLSTLDN